MARTGSGAPVDGVGVVTTTAAGLAGSHPAPNGRVVEPLVSELGVLARNDTGKIVDHSRLCVITGPLRPGGQGQGLRGSGDAWRLRSSAVQGFLDVLAGLSPVAAAGWFLAGNTMLVVVAVLGGTLLLRRAGEIRERRADRLESVLVVSAVVVNAAVGWVGWWLWRAGVIHVSPDVGPGAVVQFAVLVLAMDLALYLGHRAAHHRLVYPLVHRLHHRFTVPRPTTLFALHPVEAAGFGALWIVTLTLHPFAVPVLAAYGAVNLGFGTLGHLGVDPLPLRWRRRAVFRWLTTPMFHDDHHRHPATNLGFYTTIWDRLGGTLSPSYDARRTGTTS